VLYALKCFPQGRAIVLFAWKETEELLTIPSTLDLTVAVLQAPGGSGMMPTIVMMGVLFLIMYMLIFRPQAQKQKEWQKMLESIENGDQVVTGGGIVGIVIAVKEDRLHLRVPPDNLRLEVTRNSVMQLAKPETKEKK
jgi:preprotein translocase subunit YajC